VADGRSQAGRRRAPDGMTFRSTRLFLDLLVHVESGAVATTPSSTSTLRSTAAFFLAHGASGVKVAPVPLRSLSSPPASPVPLTPSLMPRAPRRRKPSTKGGAQWHYSRRRQPVSPSHSRTTSTSRLPTSVAGARLARRPHSLGLGAGPRRHPYLVISTGKVLGPVTVCNGRGRHRRRGVESRDVGL
jgi:hypothetical protein